MKFKVLRVFLICVLFISMVSLSSPVEAASGSADACVGQIALFTKAPSGWVLCDGRTLPINTYQALNSILGTTFGGDGKTTFAVPNLTSAAPYSGPNPLISANYYICTDGIFGLSEDCFTIGEICLLPDRLVYLYNSDSLFLKCDGSSYDTFTYQYLNASIGSNFGTNLPNLSFASPLSGLSYYIATKGTFPVDGNFSGGDPYLGSINLYAFNAVPYGELICNGQSISGNSNAALLSIIGYAYGGDNMNTFCVPDYRGIVPLPKLRYCIVSNGIYPYES